MGPFLAAVAHGPFDTASSTASWHDMMWECWNFPEAAETEFMRDYREIDARFCSRRHFCNRASEVPGFHLIEMAPVELGPIISNSTGAERKAPGGRHK